MYPTCLACHKTFAQNRGLCMRCYARYREQIRTKKTTWEQLEQEGKILPRISKSRRQLWNGGPSRFITIAEQERLKEQIPCTTAASSVPNSPANGDSAPTATPKPESLS